MLKGQLTKMEAQQKHENEMISDEVSKCQVMLQEENKVRITGVLIYLVHCLRGVLCAYHAH